MRHVYQINCATPLLMGGSLNTVNPLVETTSFPCQAGCLRTPRYAVTPRAMAFRKLRLPCTNISILLPWIFCILFSWLPRAVCNFNCDHSTARERTLSSFQRMSVCPEMYATTPRVVRVLKCSRGFKCVKSGLLLGGGRTPRGKASSQGGNRRVERFMCLYVFLSISLW